MKLRSITKKSFFLNPANLNRPWREDYLAMFSSEWQGVTTDPDLMMIPIDDHLVHRGDGVFDVMRCISGQIYQMEAHLQRLDRSAKAISLNLPSDYERIRELIGKLVVIGGERDCLIKVILSRGPGGFGISPFECPSSHMYVNVIRFRDLPDEYYEDGIPLVTSRIPIKKSFFANIKSCDYLPNVLMKMEAIESGCKYSVGLDEDDFLAEGSTENVGVLAADDILKFPGFERTLSGITVNRIFQLADQLVKEGLIRGVEFTRISLEEAYQAKEMFLTGTSLGVLPVVTYDRKRIGQGKPGRAYVRLSELLWKDMTENRDLLTRIDWEPGDFV